MESGLFVGPYGSGIIILALLVISSGSDNITTDC